MNLIKKSIIIITSSMVLLMAMSFILLQSFMLNVYIDLEEKALQDKIFVIRSSMEEQITFVNNVTKDWAYWDDTYRFSKDRNEAYIISNLTESALIHIEMNFIVIKDRAGEIIIAKRYDFEEETFLDFSEEDIKFLQEDITLGPEKRSGISGLAAMQEGIAILSFEPILTSSEEGQPSGILIMGKYVDKSQTEALSQKIQSQVGLINIYDIKNNAPLSSIVQKLQDQDQVIDYIDESRLHGYAMINDMYNKPLLLLDVNMERDIYLKGKYNIYIFYFMFFIIGIVFTGLIIFIIKNMVLLRIRNLKKEVGKIAEHKDLSKRIHASGNDEITALTADINKMLQNLEEAQQKIKYLGYHDDLTGLYNRSFFNVELKRLEHTRFLPVAIITGDVNGLKLINDAFGLEAGDRVLKKIAEILIESCRKEDIIARVSGNEFAMILPSTSYDNAMKISARIKDRIKSDPVGKIHPSISLGIAAKNEKAEKINDVFKQATDNMYKAKLLESESFRSSIIASLIKTLSEGTAETEEHSQRLKKYSMLIGKKMSLNESQLNDLALISVLHDIGKTAIPENILMKKGSLNAQEWEKMKEHSEIGYRIASSLPELASVSDSILHHHEHWDGKGYPHGLKGSRIPLLARIISIVDAFDAMTNDRIYSKAMSVEDAVMELDMNAGKQFDPTLVKMFIHIIDEENLVKTIS